MFKTFKTFRTFATAAALIALGSVGVRAATTRYVELRSTLQPNTTGLNAIFVSSGTIKTLSASTATISGPLTVTGTLTPTTIAGTITDTSTTTYSGNHTFTAATISTLSGVMTDNSTGTHSGAHTFNGGLTSSTSTLTKTTLASSTTITGPLLDKNLSAGTTFDYLNSQSSGTTSAPQWSHAGLVLQSTAAAVNAYNFTTTNSAFQASGFKVTITPKFANSIIRIWFSGDIRSSSVAGDFPFATIERNATNLAQGGGTNYFMGFTASVVTGTLLTPASCVVRDAPASTSALTYEVYLRTSAGGATASLCAGGVCSLLVEEIGQ